jgi:integrase
VGRRGHNEGSIYQRADGRWTAAIHVGFKNGKRQRKYIYGKTRREVAEKLKIALRDQQQGRALTNGRLTVGQFLDQWLTDVVRQRVRESTFRSYESYVRLHLKPVIGHLHLAKLGPEHVQAMLNDKSRALSPRSVQYLRSILRTALKQALKWDLVSRNVATLVDPPRAPRLALKPLTPAQVRTLLDAIKDDRLEALMTVAIATGLRQGELMALRWEDVELNTAQLRVRHTLQKLQGEWRFLEPKTTLSRRTIALPAIALAALRRQQIRLAEEQALVGPGWQEWGLVFPSACGTPLDASNVTHRLQTLLERAGLPRQRFHDLRHCCATLLLQQEVHPRIVMELLGHSQISLTMNTYSHVMPAAKSVAAARIDEILTQD